jgi:hypothetical protein
LYINKSFKLEENGIFNSAGNTVVAFVDGKVEVKAGSLVTARIHANDHDIHVKGRDDGGHHLTQEDEFKGHLKSRKKDHHKEKNDDNRETTMNGMFIGRKIHGENNVLWNMDRICAACEIPEQEVVANWDDDDEKEDKHKSAIIPDLGGDAFEVTMYPNPTKGLVTVKHEAAFAQEVEIAVMNIAGSEVFRKKYRSSDPIRFDLSDKVSGMYIINIEIDNQRFIKKLILDRK